MCIERYVRRMGQNGGIIFQLRQHNIFLFSPTRTKHVNLVQIGRGDKRGRRKREKLVKLV